MKVKIKVEKEVELTILNVIAEIRYWEDSEINGESDTEDGSNIPCKDGSLWRPKIDIATGKILNWEQGKTASIHYKVCDCCGWQLIDKDGEVVLSAEDGYVPDTLSPKESGWGDYIIMDIDENGIIQDWNFRFSDFEKEEED